MENTMKKLSLPSDKDGHFKLFILSLLLLLIPVALYFFVHIPDREEYFTQRHLRLLGDMSQQVSRKVNNFEANLKNASRPGLNSEDSPLSECGSDGLDTKVSEKKRGIDNSLKLIQYLKPVATFVDFKEMSLSESYADKFVGFESREDEDGSDHYSRLVIDMNREKDAYWLNFYSSVYRQDSTDCAKKEHYTAYIHAKSSMDDIMGSILARSIFDEVMLIDKKGTVRYQQKRMELLASRLDSIHVAKGNRIHASSLIQATHVGDIEIGGTSYKLFSQPLKLPVRAVDESLSDESTEVRDSTVSFGSSEMLEQSSWSLVGFVQRDKFYSQTKYISISWIIAFLFLLIFTIVSLPLFKLWYMGSHELLKRRDVALLLFCSVFGLALAVLGLFDFSYYTEIKHTLDKKLETIADQVEEQFLDELSRAHHVLSTFDDSLLYNKGPKILTGVDPKDKFEDIEFNFSSMAWIDSLGMQQVKWSTGERSTPLIDVSSRPYFQVARQQKGLWEVSLNEVQEPHHPLFIQPIFSLNTGRNETILSIPSKSNDLDRNAVAALNVRFRSLFEPILPLNFGMAVVNEAGDVLFHSDENRNLRENFVAESNELGALRSSILNGVEKSLDVDYLGRGHRLYIKPLDDIPWRILVFLDKQFVRTVNLHVLSESLLLFLIYLGILLFVILCRYWLVYFFKKDRIYESNNGFKPDNVVIWPDKEKSDAYRQVFIGNLILCSIMFVCILYTQAHQMLHLAILIPLYGFSLTFLNLRLPADVTKAFTLKNTENNNSLTSIVWQRIKYFWPASILGAIILIASWMLSGPLNLTSVNGRREISLFLVLFIGIVYSFLKITSPYSSSKDSSFRKNYVMALASLILLISALPAISMFKITFDSEVQLWTRQQLNHLVDSIEEQKQFFPKNETEEIGNFKIQFVNDKPFLEDSTISKSNQAWFRGFMSSIRPAYNELSHTLSSTNEKILQNNSIQWRVIGDSLTVTKNGIKLKAEMNRFKFVFSFSSKRAMLILIIGGLGFVVILLLLTSLISREVVLLNVEDPVRLDAKYLSSGELNKDLVVIGPPRTGKSKLFNAKKKMEFVDLALFSNAVDLYSVMPKKEANTLVLDHFEHKIEDPQWTNAKLDLLLRVRKSRIQNLSQIVVVSTSDPLELIHKHHNGSAEIMKNGISQNGVQNEIEAQKNGTNHSSISIWEKEFSSFIRVHYSNPGNPKEFKKFLKQKKKGVGTAGHKINSDQLCENLKELCAIIKEECLPMLFLQDIGKNIVKLNGFHELSPDELKSLILEWAEPYYRSIWQASSIEEKLMLSHLAREGFVNFDTKKPKTLRGLLRNGLVVRDPELRLMNKSFKDFLLSPKIRDEVNMLVLQEGASTWEKMKVPLVTLLIGVSLFVFVTQQDVFNITLAWLSALGAALPAFFRLFGLIASGRALVGKA